MSVWRPYRKTSKTLREKSDSRLDHQPTGLRSKQLSVRGTSCTHAEQMFWFIQDCTKGNRRVDRIVSCRPFFYSMRVQDRAQGMSFSEELTRNDLISWNLWNQWRANAISGNYFIAQALWLRLTYCRIRQFAGLWVSFQKKRSGSYSTSISCFNFVLLTHSL